MRERDGRWLGSASVAALRRFSGKYVAVRNRRVLASSPTMGGLYEKLDRLKPGMVLITKVEKPTLVVYVELQ